MTEVRPWQFAEVRLAAEWFMQTWANLRQLVITPVIRGRHGEKKLTEDQRHSLVSLLNNERNGHLTPGGPVIFEIPLEQSDKLDVMVVSDAWRGIRSEDRTKLIQQAYGDQADSLALGE